MTLTPLIASYMIAAIFAAIPFMLAAWFALNIVRHRRNMRRIQMMDDPYNTKGQTNGTR